MYTWVWVGECKCEPPQGIPEWELENHQCTCIKNLVWSVLAKVNDIALLICLRVMEKELNNPGRGFNIVVLDKDSKKPKFVSRFDTYEGGKEKSVNKRFSRVLNKRVRK